MVFGFGGLEINHKYDQEPHRKKDSAQSRLGDKRKSQKGLCAGATVNMKTNLTWARHEARSMGLTLEEYFKLPKDKRNY